MKETMKKNLKQFLATALATVLVVTGIGFVPAVSAVADEADGVQSVSGSTIITVTPKSATISVNETVTLTAAVTVSSNAVSANAVSANAVEWSVVSGDDVVSITAKGATVSVKGEKAGTATVQASITVGEETKSAMSTITVQEGSSTEPEKPDEPEKPTISVSVNGVTLDSMTKELEVNDEFTLTATVSSNGTNDGVEWNVDSGKDVVELSGKTQTSVTVKAVKAGKAEVTATSKDDNTKKVTCEITVKEDDKVLVTGITLNKTTAALKVGESEQLTATITPNNATDKTLTWKSSDNGVVTVDSTGKVTAVKAGEATVTVTSNNDISATCKVTVTDNVTQVEQPVKVTTLKITGDSKKIAAGKSVQLEVTVNKGASKNVTWKSSNTKYATVNSKGKVTTKKAGAGKTVTITATATDGSNKQAIYKISIMKSAVKSIKLKASKKSVKAGKSVTIKATVNPSKNVNKTLAWKSSNTKYATVNSKGKVTTKKAGAGKTVTITATATDGSKKKATIKIKITK